MALATLSGANFKAAGDSNVHRPQAINRPTHQFENVSVILPVFQQASVRAKRAKRDSSGISDCKLPLNNTHSLTRAAVATLFKLGSVIPRPVTHVVGRRCWNSVDFHLKATELRICQAL